MFFELKIIKNKADKNIKDEMTNKKYNHFRHFSFY